MAELILHHYDTSPFSEKIRKIFGFKRLAWRAVEQPSIMPKPDLLPLTGGYRRIPVLQVGADIYCDTQVITRTVERLHPSPTLYPRGSEGACEVWALWADRQLFMTAVGAVFAEIGQFMPQAFLDDRAKMAPGWRDYGKLAEAGPHAREQLRGLLGLVEAQLADGRPYLLGEAFSLADAAVYHPRWFLRVAPQATALLTEFSHLVTWTERVEELGHGQRSELTPAEALAIARAAAPASTSSDDPGEPNQLRPGMHVTVTPDDYGFDPVRGEIVFSNLHEIAIRRHDDKVGDLVVHFPRLGFRVVGA